MTLLYLGLDPSRYKTEKKIFHYPIITIEKRPFLGEVEKAFQQLFFIPIVIITSRTAASIFFEYSYRAGLSLQCLSKKLYISVGQSTAEKLPHAIVAKEERGEGVIALLESLPNIEGRALFFPHSSASRPLLSDYLKKRNFSYVDCIIYDPKMTNESFPDDLEAFDEIVFTSPSTVHAFFEKKCKIPWRLELTTIGPITHNTLLQYMDRVERKVIC